MTELKPNHKVLTVEIRVPNRTGVPDSEKKRNQVIVPQGQS